MPKYYSKRRFSRPWSSYRKSYNRRKMSRLSSRRRENYATVLYRTLGTKMNMFPISGSINLRFSNIAPLPATCATIGSKCQIMISCLYNLAEKDFFIWMSDASPFNPDVTSNISAIECQAFSSTLDSTAFSGLNPDDVAFRIDPRLAPFYKSERYWCGGLKYQWCPNKRPQALIAAADGQTTLTEYSVTLKAFSTVSPPRTAITTLKQGAPPVPYLEMLTNPFEKKQNFDYGSVSGFLKNPAPIQTTTYAFDNDGINLATLTTEGTNIDNVDTTFRLRGSANFVFEISFPPLGAAVRLVGIDLGSLNIKKYFWAHNTGVIRNTYFDNSIPRKTMMIETRSPSPDMNNLKNGFDKRLKLL